MKNMKIAQLFGAAALVLALTACGGAGGDTAPATDDTTGGEVATTDGTEADASFIIGQWRGSVKTTGETVYGAAGGSEQMLDVTFAEDGTVTVTPLENHADLLTGSGTYEATAETVTLHLGSGDITLTVVDKNKMEGNAADFGIDGFDTIDFDFFG